MENFQRAFGNSHKSWVQWGNNICPNFQVMQFLVQEFRILSVSMYIILIFFSFKLEYFQ